MILKVHVGLEGRKIVALCDDNLIGKKIEEKGLQLDLCSSFYKGEKKNETEVMTSLKGAYIVNIVGKDSINLALKKGIIEKGNIITIDKVPHAQAIIG